MHATTKAHLSLVGSLHSLSYGFILGTYQSGRLAPEHMMDPGLKESFRGRGLRRRGVCMSKSSLGNSPPVMALD